MSEGEWGPRRPAFLNGRAAGASDRRGEILRAAVRVFARQGYHGCRIADVSQEAGVAYGLVYHYFRSKDDLLRAVVAETLGHVVGLIESIALGPGSAASKIDRIVALIFDALRHDPDVVRVVILDVARGPAFRDPQLRDGFRTLISVFSNIIDQGRKSGDLRPEIDPFGAGAALFGAIEVSLSHVLVTEGISDAFVDQMRHTIVEIFLRGLCSVAPAPRPRRTVVRKT